MRFLASIQYDGSNFYGFQRLNSDRSVQRELEKVLTKINKSKVEVKGAGRTDRGVHALDQKCHFDLDININELEIKKAMNSLLPSDIYVTSVKCVDKDFHARFMVKKKIYYYVINIGDFDAVRDKYMYNYCKPLNIKKMRKAAKYLIGKNSYKAFVSGERENYDSEIYKIKFIKRNNKLIIRFIGSSFYRYMIRNMVGALILVGSNKINGMEIKEMIYSGNRINYMTVPSNGLFLERIEY